MFHRIVLKLSGEALAGENDIPAIPLYSGNTLQADRAEGNSDTPNNPGNTLKKSALYDDSIVDSIVFQIKTVMEKGTQVALVVGGGNIWRGRDASSAMDRVKADQIGMLATVMNALYLQDSFRRQGVKAQVATPIPFGNMTALYERDTAVEWLQTQTVVINAAGLGHPLFSTDTIAALRAAELGADCILYAKNIDGVYHKNPRIHPDARKYRSLSYKTALSESLEAADMAALHLSVNAGIPSFMFKLDEPNSIIHACDYPETGSLQGTYIDKIIEEVFYDKPKSSNQ